MRERPPGVTNPGLLWPVTNLFETAKGWLGGGSGLAQHDTINANRAQMNFNMSIVSKFCTLWCVVLQGLLGGS